MKRHAQHYSRTSVPKKPHTNIKGEVAYVVNLKRYNKKHKKQLHGVAYRTSPSLRDDYKTNFLVTHGEVLYGSVNFGTQGAWLHVANNRYLPMSVGGFTVVERVGETHTESSNSGSCKAQGHRGSETLCGISVQSGVKRNGVAFYHISAQTDKCSLSTFKRFREFHSFHKSLEKSNHNQDLVTPLPVLPNKHTFSLKNHLSNGFIKQRRAELDEYLKQLSVASSSIQSALLTWLSKEATFMIPEKTELTVSYTDTKGAVIKIGLSPDDEDVVAVPVGKDGAIPFTFQSTELGYRIDSSESHHFIPGDTITAIRDKALLGIEPEVQRKLWSHYLKDRVRVNVRRKRRLQLHINGVCVATFKNIKYNASTGVVADNNRPYTTVPEDIRESTFKALHVLASQAGISINKNTVLLVSQKVRVKKEVDMPRYGWGGVQRDWVGTVVKCVFDDVVEVDFPLLKGWKACPDELVICDGCQEVNVYIESAGNAEPQKASLPLTPTMDAATALRLLQTPNFRLRLQQSKENGGQTVLTFGQQTAIAPVWVACRSADPTVCLVAGPPVFLTPGVCMHCTKAKQAEQGISAFVLLDAALERAVDHDTFSMPGPSGAQGPLLPHRNVSLRSATSLQAMRESFDEDVNGLPSLPDIDFSKLLRAQGLETCFECNEPMTEPETIQVEKKEVQDTVVPIPAKNSVAPEGAGTDRITHDLHAAIVEGFRRSRATVAGGAVVK